MAKRGGPQPPKPGTASAIREASRAGQPDRPDRPTKRVYTPEFKRRVLRDLAVVEASGERGAVGAFLRREGLVWPTVNRWRHDASKAELTALAPKKAGRKPMRDAAAEELARLRREVGRLQAELHKAEVIIDVQKKLSALLGVELPPPPDEDDKP